MQKISKELMEKYKTFRELQYQELYKEQPGIKRFLAVRKILLWFLRIMYFINFICAVILMAWMNNFSQLGTEIIRLLIGLFILWIAGRAFLGIILLWLAFAANVIVIAENIGLLTQIDSNYPLDAIIAYFVQMLIPVILFLTALFLCLPSNRRYLNEIIEVEKASNIYLMSQMPNGNNSNLYSTTGSVKNIREIAMYDNRADEDTEDIPKENSAIIAMKEASKIAAENGIGEMPLEEINAEITEARNS